MYMLMARKGLTQRPLQTVLTAGAIAAAVAAAVIVMQLSSGLWKGITGASEPFDLIAGAKGSPNQLVLNTVFLQDAPIGNIGWETVESLTSNPLADTVIPIGYGDNYLGFRIAGTVKEIFSHSVKKNGPPWLKLAEGKPFEKPFDAVIGAKTAKETGLKTGSRFSSSHGIFKGAKDTHGGEEFTVTGILEPVNGPYDGAILTPIESIWQSHAHDGKINKAATAVMVKPKGYGEALELYRQFQGNKDAQLIFPAQTVARLFSILGEGKRIMEAVSLAVLIMAAALTAFSVYWSVLSRTAERAVLRALGAGRKAVLSITLLESGLISLSGAAAGILAGYAAFALIACKLNEKTSISMPADFSPSNMLILSGIVLAGLTASLIPALIAAGRDAGNDL